MTGPAVSLTAARSGAATMSAAVEGTPETASTPSVAQGLGRAGAQSERAPEMTVALDMMKLAVFFAVPLLLGGALAWGWNGMASVALALALVLVNFALGAAVIGWGARINSTAMIVGVMGGYLLRLGIVTAAVLPVADHRWFEVAPFAVSLLATHLGLLAIESRRVSASLAFPGLKPSSSKPGHAVGAESGPTAPHVAAAAARRSSGQHPDSHPEPQS